MQNADYTGCATSEDVNFVTKYGHSNKIVPINYPINVPNVELSVDDIRVKFDIKKEKFWISAGGFSPHKGMLQLAQCMNFMDFPSTELILIGYDSSNAQYIKTLAALKNIYVWQSSDPMPVYELMSAADLLIWNSINVSEGYGLVLLEAMKYGCPWIGTNTAGAKDLSKLGYGEVYDTADELTALLGKYATRPDSNCTRADQTHIHR